MKIIGYKLKDEKYREAALNIIGVDKTFPHLNKGCDFMKDSIAKKEMEEAGVMHWFEPVYEKQDPKVGEWWTDGTDFFRVGRIEKGIDGAYSYEGISLFGSNKINFHAVWHGSHLKRKATPEEIERALTKVCEARYPEGTTVKCMLTNNFSTTIEHETGRYIKDDDIFFWDTFMVYRQGQFAKVEEEKLKVGNWEVEEIINPI